MWTFVVFFFVPLQVYWSPSFARQLCAGVWRSAVAGQILSTSLAEAAPSTALPPSTRRASHPPSPPPLTVSLPRRPPPPPQPPQASPVRVLLSVATRNRFWPHALSMISLADAVVHARSSSVQRDVVFEWHVIDDASDENVQRKDAMVRDMVNRGLVNNYTKLERPSGTVHVLRQFVDVVLSRPDLDFWLHCDDDVLASQDLLVRAVEDYRRDLAGGRWRFDSTDGTESQKVPHASGGGGGVLSIFVNSWLDEHLSSTTPAFGPYKVGPFLGGASYVVDRATLVQTGNPWFSAMASNDKVSPHDAHVHWLRHLLPKHNLPIWIRWERPYQCQHLGNVNTLNFGRQPDWEAMWAIDHQTKRIVEVAGYDSVEVRAALWSGGETLRDYVLSCNARLSEPLRLPRSRTWPRSRRWSVWDYPKIHANYVEIGTSDFDALAQRHAWRPDVVGLSVEPIKLYAERLRLPTGSANSANKTVLTAAIGDYDGFTDVFLVPPELVDGYMGAESFCKPESPILAGLLGDGCLPGWVRGAATVGRRPESVRQLLGDDKLHKVLAVARVPMLTFPTLLTVYGIGSVDIVKIDAEGLDHIILRQIMDLGEKRGLWPWQVQFKNNTISNWRAIEQQVARLQGDFGYRCRMTSLASAACWRPGRAA
eukprot:TRINITY_DN67149_c0_g1_i1.p1 TRINITY_DN67149_c0_g1~~TRINITY_DN67149_c0_g1_i1.p1  ORF type:complete len:651 (-),score=74.94 TRINITY_DN67149_c0_g1_i1:222-2174(-)